MSLIASQNILTIGAINIDRKAWAAQPVVLGSSNPVTVSTAPGGVARNVAETMARLGASATLAGAIGADQDGAWVLSETEQAGVDTRPVIRCADHPTASYTAFLDPSGDLVVGLADMAIHEALSAQTILGVLPPSHNWGAWFLDANLSAITLAGISRACPDGTLLAADAVSVAKAPRLSSILDRLDLLVANADEIGRLLPHASNESDDLEGPVQCLLEQGVGSVIVGRGAKGVYVADETTSIVLPPIKTDVVDVTGAGDGMIGGTLAMLLEGADLRTAATAGLATASLATESIRAVPIDLTRAAVLDRVAFMDTRG